MTDEEVREYVRAEIARLEPIAARGYHAERKQVNALRRIADVLDALPRPNLWARAMGAK